MNERERESERERNRDNVIESGKEKDIKKKINFEFIWYVSMYILYACDIFTKKQNTIKIRDNVLIFHNHILYVNSLYVYGSSRFNNLFVPPNIWK